MGVKYTVELSRREVIERLIVYQQRRERRRLEAVYADFSDTSLENALERVNDEESGGQGFENYSIVPERN